MPNRKFYLWKGVKNTRNVNSDKNYDFVLFLNSFFFFLLFGGLNLRSIINSPSLILSIYFLFLIIYSNYKYFYGCLVL